MEHQFLHLIIASLFKQPKMSANSHVLSMHIRLLCLRYTNVENFLKWKPENPLLMSDDKWWLNHSK